MSGHNKWSSIKHKKKAQDAKRSKIFSRLVKEIHIAVKEGGNDPEANPRLRMAIQNAKGVNMPKENIERAITKANSDSESLQSVTFEGYAPSGIGILIDCLTDNNQRTVNAVRATFNKKGGSLATKGSLSYLFNTKGVFTIPKKDQNREEFELEVIDAGVEDIEEDEEYFTLYTEKNDFGNVQKKLEKLGIEPENSGLQRIPATYKKVDVETGKKVMKIVEALENLDDVQDVYHNMEMTEEIMNAVEV